ncbi:hypothetical protein HF521_012501 [Silurus meridionalis]|uniref:Mesothelin-like protein n=2 Tax=Silurus meridionalis TaxID=175797 RepID=A0A8T0ADB6_SILME|nr:hypothetical protein HF521_012501 [Silurus meridionalis]
MSATSNALLNTTASTINSFEISTSAGTNVNTTATSNPFYTANASTTANMEITSSFQNNSGTSVNMTTANISLITSASTMTTFDISNSIGANVNMSTTSNALLTTTASTLTSIENNTSPETNNNMSATSNALLTTTASTTTSFEISTSAGTNVNMSTTINALRTTTPFPSASFEISTSAVTNVNMSTTSNALLTTTASPLTSIETNTSPETNNNMSAPNNALLTTTASTSTSFEISTSAGTNVNMSTTSNALRTTTPFPSASFEISTSSGTNVNMSTTSNALLTTTASPLTSIETNTPPETNNNMSATSNAPLTTTASTINSFEISTSAGTNVNTTATSNPFYTVNASTTANMEITSSFQSNSGTSNTLITSASPMTSFEISTSIGPNLNKSSTSNDLLPVPDFSSTSFETNISPGTNNNMSATSNAPLTNTPSPSASFEISTSAGTNNNMSATSNAPLTTNASTTASFKISTAAGTNVSISTTSNALLTTISAENTAFTENAIISTTASTILNIKATTLFENFVNITVNPCQNVDSQTFESTHLDGNISALLCNISITYYACSSVTILSTDELAKLLICEMEGSIKYPEEVWKLFFYKFTGPLDEALDRISNMTLSRANADPNILDAIGEVIIKDFTIAQIKNVTFVRIWFLVRFRLFLSSVSTDFLFNLSSKNFSCETYQIVVEALGSQESLMTKKQKQWVFTSFIFPFLSRVDLPDPGCVSSTSGSNDWFEKNLGNFSNYATLKELQILNANFSSVAVFGLLSSEQKAEFILQPDAGVLGNDSVFREVFGRMITSLDLNQLVSFFTAFSQIAIQMNMTSIPSATSDTILNITLMNLAPHFQSFSSKDFALWFQTYLSIFLPVTGPSTLSIIPMNISCNSYREIVKGLNNVYSNLSVTQSNTIFSYIQDYLKYQSSQGLSCYGSGSFYMFLKQLFLSFGFPDLNDFLSLIPADRQAEILSSISTEELSEYLKSTNPVINGSELCTLLNNYNRTTQYLEMEPVLSSALASRTLECVWPRALSASSQADVEQWFNVTLLHYLPYLSSQLISSTQLSGASCLSYRKLVSILGYNYTFAAADFTPADVYSSIKEYLSSGNGSPRCYNSSDPLLNSTAWFVDNIGFFITFITLTDLQSFLSGDMLGLFVENSENLQLFNNSKIAVNVTEYYTTQLYIQNSNFNPLRLPGALICNAPGSVFVPFGVEDTQTILTNINKFCSKTNPEITATLVEKFSTVSGPTIQLLGSQSGGLTVGQISSAPYSAISNALPVLGNINGWDQGQANALIQSIISAGFDISGSSSLLSLGTLIEGVPSATISSIPSSQLLSLSQNQKFINNILSAPVILQEAYVQQIITVDQTKVIENVPDALAMYIPVVLLTSVSFVDVSFINNKSWSQEQAMMLFGAVTSASDNPEDLSASVLQGFTCSSIQTLPRQKIKDLVKACRPRADRDKVLLKESQLTCMYNNIKEGSVNFTDVPSDMLLYYSYDKVQRGNCRSYFTALGRADFSVPSTVLNKPATLFKNAQDCLGISGMSLTRDHVEVLGNMACTLDSSYIYNSDPVILENLKNCGDLSDSQINSVQSLLLSGNTAYGNPSKWNAQTLGQLGILPLYFKSDFWGQFNFDLKKKFLKSFMPFLRDRKTPIQKRRNFFMECNSKVSKVRRAAECTTGYITNMIIADASFPVGYDSTQFDLCLNVTVLQDNLAAITEKVVDPSFLTIILNKLNQIYPSGLTDRVLQLMGPTSRVATISDISNWKITVIDTLSSLMKSDNGNWASEMSKAVIMGYLNMANHTLGSAEINAVGSNICSLDVSVLENITPESLKNAFTLDLSSCSIQQKSALYIIAKSSFSGQNNTYQLIRPYLGGAPVQDIQFLSSQNVSMDITTLLNLDPAVIMALNVSTVQGLLGVNVADLKLFENSTVVRSWVAQQYQQDLNILSIGLTGGNPPSVTSQSSVTTVTTSQTNQTTSSNTTTQGSSAPILHAGAQYLLCVGLLTFTQTLSTT